MGIQKVVSEGVQLNFNNVIIFFQVDEGEKRQDLNTTKSLWVDNGPTLNAELIAL